jgi:hypothetical protein
MALDSRIAALEQLVAHTAAKDDAAAFHDSDEVAVLNELSDMQAMMSESSYRGSPNGLIKIEPRDVAREYYGRDYTRREYLELAILRALEGKGYDEETIEERTPDLLEVFTVLWVVYGDEGGGASYERL